MGACLCKPRPPRRRPEAQQQPDTPAVQPQQQPQKKDTSGLPVQSTAADGKGKPEPLVDDTDPVSAIPEDVFQLGRGSSVMDDEPAAPAMEPVPVVICTPPTIHRSALDRPPPLPPGGPEAHPVQAVADYDLGSESAASSVPPAEPPRSASWALAADCLLSVGPADPTRGRAGPRGEPGTEEAVAEEAADQRQAEAAARPEELPDPPTDDAVSMGSDIPVLAQPTPGAGEGGRPPTRPRSHGDGQEDDSGEEEEEEEEAMLLDEVPVPTAAGRDPSPRLADGPAAAEPDVATDPPTDPQRLSLTPEKPADGSLQDLSLPPDRHRLRQAPPADFLAFQPDRCRGIPEPPVEVAEWLRALPETDPYSRFPARLLDKFRDGVRAFVQSARPQWSRALSETEAWAVVTYTSELYDDGPMRRSWRHQIYAAFNAVYRRHARTQRPPPKTLAEWTLFEPLAYYLNLAIRALPPTSAVLYCAMSPKEEECQFVPGLRGGGGGFFRASASPDHAGLLGGVSRDDPPPPGSRFALLSDKARCVTHLSPFPAEQLHLHPLDTEWEVCPLPPHAVLQLLSPPINVAVLKRADTSPSLEQQLAALQGLGAVYAEFLQTFVPPLVKLQPESVAGQPLLREVGAFLDSWRRCLLLVGEAGAGKTAAALWLTHVGRLRGWLWLYVALPAVPEPFQPDALVDYLRGVYGAAAVAALQDESVVLVLDGVEDVPPPEGKGDRSWWRLNGLDQWHAAKLIVTCRAEPAANYAGPGAAVLYVQPFTEAQQRCYVRSRLSPTSRPASPTSRSPPEGAEPAVDRVLALLRASPHRALYSTPLRLQLLLTLLSSPSPASTAAAPSEPDLVASWLELWVQQAQERVAPGADGDLADLWLNAERLAWELHRTKAGMAQVEERGAHGWFRCLPLRVYDYTPSSLFSFYHNSIKDFLVAKHVLRNVQERAGTDFLSQLHPQQDSPVLDFMAGLARCLDPGPLNDLQGRLFELVLASVGQREEPLVGQTAAVSITLLHRLGVRFHAMDLAGVSIPGAVLRRADLRGCNLHNADLRQVDLQGSVLDFADLEGADLTGATIGLWQTLRHGAPAPAAATADCERLLTPGAAPGEARLWQGPQGRDLRTLRFTYLDQNPPASPQRVEATVQAVALAADGDAAAVWFRTAEQRGVPPATYVLFGRPVGEEERWLRPAHMHGIALSGDGRVLAVWSMFEQAQVCLVYEWPPAEEPRRTVRLAGGVTTALALSHDGAVLLTGHRNGAVRAWDTLRGALLRQLADQGEGHRDAVLCVAASRSGEVLASGAQDGSVCLWSPNWSLSRQLLGHSAPVCAVSLCGRGQRVATGGRDGSVSLWSTGTGVALRHLPGHPTAVTLLQLSRDGRLLLAGYADKLTLCSATADSSGTAQPAGHSAAVTSLALSADGQVVLTGSEDNTALVWVAATGEVRLTLRHPAAVAAVAASGSGTTCVTGCDRTIYLWDGSSGTSLGDLKGHTGRICALALSDDGDILASGARDQTTRVWRVSSGELLFQHKWRFQGPNHVAVTPDGALVAHAKENVQLWKAETGRVTTLEESGRNALVAFSGDGRRLLEAHHRVLRLCKLPSGTVMRTFEGHEAPITCAALSRNGKTVVSGAADSVVLVWDVAAGQLLRALLGHTQSIAAVATTEDGSAVFSAAADGTVRRWAPLIDECEVWRDLRSPTATVLALGCQVSPDTRAADYLLQQLLQAGAKLPYMSVRSPPLHQRK
eukprot:EG_transcript_167